MRWTDVRPAEYAHGHIRGELTINRSPLGPASHHPAGHDPAGEGTHPYDAAERYPQEDPRDAAGRADDLTTGSSETAVTAASANPATHPPRDEAPAASPAVQIVPGPPGGVLDLGALATVEARLRDLAGALVDHAEATGARHPEDARADRTAVAAGSTIAAVLWFDALRAEDRVSVTPHAAALVRAVHHVLEGALAPTPSETGWGPAEQTGTGQTGSGSIIVPPATGRPPRRTGAGNIGPSGTIWSALAGRYAGVRFDRTPAGRQICLIDFAELRDPAIWEAVTDERVTHLGELFWVVMVSGAAPAGAGGVGGPTRAARMFEAAGWQVLTLRYGRRLAALFQAPGGAALRARLDGMSPGEYRSLLSVRGEELRRRLAGPGASGVGISRLLDTLSDQEIVAALHDLGGHDLPLLIDVFDEVDRTRPSVLFAFTGPFADGDDGDDDGRDGHRGSTNATDWWLAEVDDGHAEGDDAPRRIPSGHRPDPDLDAGADPGVGDGDAAGTVVPGMGMARPLDAASRAPRPVSPLLPAGSSGARLARHVASYLDRAPIPLTPPPVVPTESARAFVGWRSTQDAFGALLRDLPELAPPAAAAVVTVSTREADRVLSGWLDDRHHAAPGPGAEDDRSGDARDVLARQADAGGGRHVAGGLSASAFGGVLASLGVAWSRQGLSLLPVGVADEVSAERVLPTWAAGAAADARSVLAVADTGLDPARPGGWRGASVGVPGVGCWEPAFGQDLIWCLLAALGRLGRPDGGASLLRLSARPVDQRLAALPNDPTAWMRRRAGVLAGGYRLRDGGPAPVLTLVGMGAVLPEVLRAADELRAGLRREIAVVCVTSPDLLFDALQARRGLLRAEDGILAELFPPDRRTPLVTVVDGDPRMLSFLAAVRGDHITTLGSATPSPDPIPTGERAGEPADSSVGTPAPGPDGRVPVAAETIVGAALDLLDEAG